jgi:hypothetical protein
MQNGNWEDFDFPDACDVLMCEIYEVLYVYGQNFDGEEGFVDHSLEMNFPGWTTIYAGHYGEIGYGMQLAVQEASKNGNMYCIFDDPLFACQELETKRFHKLQEQYKNDQDILNLKEISGDISIIASEGDNEFSQVEMISLIYKALYAKHPNGIVFNLKIEQLISVY